MGPEERETRLLAYRYISRGDEGVSIYVIHYPILQSAVVHILVLFASHYVMRISLLWVSSTHNSYTHALIYTFT